MYRIAVIPLILAIACISGGCTPNEKTRDTGWDEGGPSAASRIKDAPVPRIHPNTHIAAGQMLEGRGDLAGAIDQYERAVAINPRYGLAYQRLATAYQKLGSQDDADSMLRRGVEADPNSALLRNNLGYRLLQLNRFAEAEQEFRKAVALSPKFRRAHMNLAILLAHQGRYQDAVAEFAQVVPRDVAFFNLGIVCAQNRDFTAAEQALRQALVLNEQCPGAREQLDRVLQLAAGETQESAATTEPLAADFESAEVP